jgi:hypothetical protein
MLQTLYGRAARIPSVSWCGCAARNGNIIAPAYVFLAAPTMSNYITGEIIPILAGYAGG